MIESFFQSLEQERVAYLLISGQATILYGAAMFSEDIDLWVEPSVSNIEPLRRVMHAVGATYYKLTPPLDETTLVRGHGFHFRLPDEPEVYVDVMGQPPRVPIFSEVLPDAVEMTTAWGRIPTIGIKHLVALKTTQRLEDYPVITQLVLRYMERTAAPDEADFRWALDNLYTADALVEFLRAHPDASGLCGQLIPVGSDIARQMVAGEDIEEPLRMDLERWFGERMLVRRQSDREYWREIIKELRGFRRAGMLMPVGELVRV